MSTVIVNLGFGNLSSVRMALERLGSKPLITCDKGEIRDAERLVVPGVGAASFAADQIGRLGLAEVLTGFPRPVMGICLGMQLLYERSEEGDVPGLGVFQGTVTRMQGDRTRPIPHMGWNSLSLRNPEHPLFEGVANGAFVYFVHSFAAPVGADTNASCEYGEPFTAVAGHGHLLGCQFHPERSGPVGERILANFLALPAVLTMLARRIIPCLDMKDGHVVKGVRFGGHERVGEPVALALQYSAGGADELVFYDISASPERRTVDLGWVTAVARAINIPFTVAGGIRSLADALACLEAGADKVSVNSPALDRPQLIEEIARVAGSQCVVVGVDSLAREGSYGYRRTPRLP
ncbi:imidazole glycerol phosphate synthase subunit HisH [Reyranella sp.]|uniref:imidazole glycerol phosphate synthase subunit HisH n=1 Tax=Reyranella sp. TaxID=1929291 RepID=UPI000B205EA2